MVMPNSPVSMPTTPNKQLYNGGSEWQNDYSNLPDYYQTFYRNYDAAIGRFNGVDPLADANENMSVYQYAINNPIMMNDPIGDYQQGNTAGVNNELLRLQGEYNDWGVLLGASGGNAGGGGGGDGGFFPTTGQYVASQNLLLKAKSGDADAINEYAQIFGTTFYGSGKGLEYQDGAFLAIIGKLDVAQENKTSVPTNLLSNVPSYGYTSYNGNTPLFGTTLSTQTAVSTGNSSSLIGKTILELKYTRYDGYVNDKSKGILNFNNTARNSDLSHDVSVDIGRFSFSMGLTSRSVSYNGYAINFNTSIFEGITLGTSQTTNNGVVSGSEFTANPFKIIPAAAAAAAYYSPYLVPLIGL